MEDLDDDIVFGVMWVTIGTLKLIRTSNANYSVKCQFWGEPSPAILETRSDLSHNDEQRTQRYDVKCPAPYFAEYLTEMNNKFRLEVTDVGKVSFDMSKFLKKKYNLCDKLVSILITEKFLTNAKGSLRSLAKETEKLACYKSKLAVCLIPKSQCRP